MATVSIPLPIPGGLAPDGSGSGNTLATPAMVVSPAEALIPENTGYTLTG